MPFEIRLTESVIALRLCLGTRTLSLVMALTTVLAQALPGSRTQQQDGGLSCACAAAPASTRFQADARVMGGASQGVSSGTMSITRARAGVEPSLRHQWLTPLPSKAASPGPITWGANPGPRRSVICPSRT